MECFFRGVVGLSQEEAKTQANETGWKSLAQVQAIWYFLRCGLEVNEADARQALVDFSWKLRCVQNLPEDRNLYQIWLACYVARLGYSFSVAKEQMLKLMLENPERLRDNPNEMCKIVVVLSGSRLSHEDRAVIAMRFKDGAQAQALWLALYRIGFSNEEATKLLSDVLNWYFIEADWIKNKWSELYARKDHADARAALAKELIDWGYKTCRH